MNSKMKFHDSNGNATLSGHWPLWNQRTPTPSTDPTLQPLHDLKVKGYLQETFPLSLYHSQV